MCDKLAEIPKIQRTQLEWNRELERPGSIMSEWKKESKIEIKLKLSTVSRTCREISASHFSVQCSTMLYAYMNPISFCCYLNARWRENAVSTLVCTSFEMIYAHMHTLTGAHVKCIGKFRCKLEMNREAHRRTTWKAVLYLLLLPLILYFAPFFSCFPPFFFTFSSIFVYDIYLYMCVGCVGCVCECEC